MTLQDNKILQTMGALADQHQFEVYVVGGFVRDFFLKRDRSEMDFVVVGDGIKFARLVAEHLHLPMPAVYQNFGTAMLKWDEMQLEFVSARKESYRAESRKPQVEPADLLADLSRRDFTINAMAFALNAGNWGTLVDPFDGMKDLNARLLRTPLDPSATFSDDPLRIMRGIRFATQLGFTIEVKTLRGMRDMRERLRIISQERITEELLKILAAPKPSIGFHLLEETEVLEIIFPELLALRGVEEYKGYFHKDVFNHTLMVLDNLAVVSEKIPLRLAALLHDIAKPRTKAFMEGKGWTFHGHEEVGSRMLPAIFHRLRLPNDWLKYVQKLTKLHLRPIALTEEECTDSAYRRLLFQAGEDLEDLLMLCRADITSGNVKRRERHLANFDFVVKRLNEVEEKDRMRAFQSPVRGDEIMQVCGLTPGPLVGKLKSAIEEAILDGKIPNEHDAALAYLLEIKDEILNGKEPAAHPASDAGR
ncbi:MAG: CCA tRNA nucleotidyltransferase [candidate division KSB1 bacterium]|nr:CCA tRNA nucleotidyltransferase [candidate division KSB1 bacterium]MDZ7301972.1 CCA tRNA nucleotidyltransferase [candidate division KSB1 bacterium]MDZ7312377.1 CCA tRNA nucleotidyltransferase [candidate division KSB1 bacterium]